jgi:AcrR family transcriptional regulator
MSSARTAGTAESIGPAPAREGTNARGEATRELILLTAERLFAARGIEAVPLRDIGAAAEQKNHFAVQYHFGDRDRLVHAIVVYRAERIMATNTDVLADLVADGRALTPADFVRAMVTALAVHLDDDSHFLPFISRYIIERGGYAGLEDTVQSSLGSQLRTILLRLLPAHTTGLLDERWEILFTSVVHTLARYQVAIHDGTLAAPLEWLIEDLIRAQAAMLEAHPPS